MYCSPMESEMMTTLRKSLWVLAAVLLILCLRVNAERSVDGQDVCADKEWVSKYSCTVTRVWSVSIKLPWRQW
jgi:hypothetical protein